MKNAEWQGKFLIVVEDGNGKDRIIDDADTPEEAEENASTYRESFGLEYDIRVEPNE